MALRAGFKPLIQSGIVNVAVQVQLRVGKDGLLKVQSPSYSGMMLSRSQTLL